jgi:beta-phosphoglucomutase-like phosphatase (HAD superfamily)
MLLMVSFHSATELPGQVRKCMADIGAQLDHAPASKPLSGKLLVEADANLAARAADLSGALAKLIQKASSSSSSSMNSERLVELLSLNDELTELIASRFVPKPKPKLEDLSKDVGVCVPYFFLACGMILIISGY